MVSPFYRRREVTGKTCRHAEFTYPATQPSSNNPEFVFTKRIPTYHHAIVRRVLNVECYQILSSALM